MKVGLNYNDETKEIFSIKDYSGITEKGQVSHFLAEIEIIKLELLDIWDRMNGNYSEEEDED